MRVRIAEIQAMKERGEPIPCVTSYDYPTARIADEATVGQQVARQHLAHVIR